MQLHQLEYFCAVARCRNMSRAADELWISQSSLSKAISSLEDELGVKLFDRVGRTLRLNEAGHLFYQQVSRVLRLLSDATKQVAQIRQRDKNEVHVLFTAATFIASHMKDAFEERCPDANVVLRCSYYPEKRDLVDCDFHIFATPATSPDLTTFELLEEEMLLAFGQKHPLARMGSAIDLEDTSIYPYQCLPPHENMHENLIGAFNKIGREPNIGFCTDDSFAFFGALRSNSLLAMIPAKTAFVVLDGLVVKRIRTPLCTRKVMMGYHKDRERTDMCKAFMEFCVEFFRDLGETEGMSRT